MLNIIEGVVGLVLCINETFLCNISSKHNFRIHPSHIFIFLHWNFSRIWNISHKYYGVNSVHQYGSCFIFLWHSLWTFMKTKLYHVFRASSSLLESHDRTFKINKTILPSTLLSCSPVIYSCEKSKTHWETSPTCLKHRENYLWMKIACPASPPGSVFRNETTEINSAILSLI
jgi:hypothetical protein